MPDSNTQIRNQKIQSYEKTDYGKLIALQRHIKNTYSNIRIVMEPFLLFTKGEDEFKGWRRYVTKSQVNNFNVIHADMVLMIDKHDNGFGRYSRKDDDIFVELDGKIHHIKTEKTNRRDDLYRFNKLKMIKIDEEELRLEYGYKKSKPMPISFIIDDFDRQFRFRMRYG